MIRSLLAMVFATGIAFAQDATVPASSPTPTAPVLCEAPLVPSPVTGSCVCPPGLVRVQPGECARPTPDNAPRLPEDRADQVRDSVPVVPESSESSSERSAARRLPNVSFEMTLQVSPEAADADAVADTETRLESFFALKLNIDPRNVVVVLRVVAVDTEETDARRRSLAVADAATFYVADVTIVTQDENGVDVVDDQAASDALLAAVTEPAEMVAALNVTVTSVSMLEDPVVDESSAPSIRAALATAALAAFALAATF